jgi:excinuclease ABC subunit A
VRSILIASARENNLKDVSLEIPHYQLVVVTGVSGSGKTSLVYDVICAEGRHLFLENFRGGRIQQGQPSRPKVSGIGGLFPVIAIDQKQGVRNSRSTVGTLTEIYDLLRLLFARLGEPADPDVKPYRSLFSFNLPDGWCPACKGIGEQDHIDPGLLIGNPSKTIREGAFVLTTPNHYIVYSQVTMEVLDQVCRAEGFSVDIPWQELTEEQKRIVLYGSTKIKVLFGKHPLESRLKWTGITAKPREEDYYKGILTVMEDILRRERNPNIMRFARSRECGVCRGKRLNDKALSVKYRGLDMAGFAAMSIRQLDDFFHSLEAAGREAQVLDPVREVILKRTALLIKLGAGHLTLDRVSPSLSGGESQRIRLANQAASGLRNVLYVLDEPSAGLHPAEHRDLLEVMRTLVDAGNTVVLVDHDEQSIREADWIVDIGPGAGPAGGEILFNGPAVDFFGRPQPRSITRQYLPLADPRGRRESLSAVGRPDGFFSVPSADLHNLRAITPRFRLNDLNVITGVSGSGKTSLVDNLLDQTIPRKLGGTDIFRKIIHIDASPIGRTPKSNPATYTGLSDHVRDLFAALPESKRRGYKKGRFSFVVKGGRCEACGGAGVQQIGMHFLGNVEVVCDVCEGRRFTPETLEIEYNGKNIYDILELTVDEAHVFFGNHKRITAITGILAELGLGYLKLGQPSTTLSGGEAQRVKLATELSKQAGGHTLYILDEPTTGLHMADVETLLKALKKLTGKGHTLLCIEHDPAFILEAGWMVDLGPGSANEGGTIVTEGPVGECLHHPSSVTAAELRKYLDRGGGIPSKSGAPCSPGVIGAPIRLEGVETHNLKHIDAAFPVDQVTLLTGVSGSGKSSLAYGTLYAESQRRFLEGLSSYSRQFQAKSGVPVLSGSFGLVPSVALQKKNAQRNPRSTVATYTGLYDLYRLMFSRMAESGRGVPRPLSTAFSFNHDEGACPVCKGLGTLTVCDPGRLVTDPGKPLTGGALDGTKTGRFYGDPYGQYVATLLAAGTSRGMDFSVPFRQLGEQEREVALRGCGEEIFDVEWKYRRGNREGVHRMKSAWPGFLGLVETEYFRKHADARGEAMLDLMKSEACSGCGGYRLKREILDFRIRGLHIGEVTALSAEEALDWFSGLFQGDFTSEVERQVALAFSGNIPVRLDALMRAGLGYLGTDRVTGTLSGGEYQRLQLAGLVRAPLTGVAYILDEPSFGLHPTDARRIAGLIEDLNRHGNSIILIDHSPVMLERAHHVIEMGPEAGSEGGRIVWSGDAASYRTRLPVVDPPAVVKGHARGEGLTITGAHANNLKNIDLSIPSGIMTVITGVSGSGKTSLLDRVIYPTWLAGHPVNCKGLAGFDRFRGLIYIEQPLPGKGYSATTASFLGLSEVVAGLFAAQPEAKKHKLKTSHFTRGTAHSRCPVCEGTGVNPVSMDFFSDVVSPCDRCGGTGFRDEVLDIRLEGLPVSDVLQIPFDRLGAFIAAHQPSRIKHPYGEILGLAVRTGLGHLHGDRRLQTLSTGELQRLKLVSGLSVQERKEMLILLDEPTGGLHPKDIRLLLDLFSELTNLGNTLVCITHESLLADAAGKVVELGPGGGVNGGRIIGS